MLSNTPSICFQTEAHSEKDPTMVDKDPLSSCIERTNNYLASILTGNTTPGISFGVSDFFSPTNRPSLEDEDGRKNLEWSPSLEQDKENQQRRRRGSHQDNRGKVVTKRTPAAKPTTSSQSVSPDTFSDESSVEDAQQPAKYTTVDYSSEEEDEDLSIQDQDLPELEDCVSPILEDVIDRLEGRKSQKHVLEIQTTYTEQQKATMVHINTVKKQLSTEKKSKEKAEQALAAEVAAHAKTKQERDELKQKLRVALAKSKGKSVNLDQLVLIQR